MKSCIYEGAVRHRRFAPVPHEFRYRLFMMYLDLAELPAVFKGRLFWSAWKWNLACLLRKDHDGPEDVPLDESIRRLVYERTGRRPAGPIRLLTHLRYFGHCFNPVSFYYCFDEHDDRVDCVVAEITNTPWKERHCYVLDGRDRVREGRTQRHRFAKSFHVSPFMPMEHDYDWRLGAPGRKLVVHMNNLDAGRKQFDATLTLNRRELRGTTLARVLLQYPLMTVQVIAAIHWQALKLWAKKTPFFPHPKWSTRSTEA